MGVLGNQILSIFDELPEDVEAIELSLPFPPSVNTYWRHVVIKGRSVTLLSKQGREYRTKASCELLRQGLSMRKLSGRLEVQINVFPPDRRKRDLDNIPKGVLDALTKAEVWEDDEQIDDLRITRAHVIKGGRVDITIKPIQE